MRMSPVAARSARMHTPERLPDATAPPARVRACSTVPRPLERRAQVRSHVARWLADSEVVVHHRLVRAAVELPRAARQPDLDRLRTGERDAGQLLLEGAALLLLEHEVVDRPAV